MLNPSTYGVQPNSLPADYGYDSRECTYQSSEDMDPQYGEEGGRFEEHSPYELCGLVGVDDDA